VGIVFLGLLIIGPGAIALKRKRKAFASSSGGESKPKKPKD
jgi:hypothetical protein